MKTFSLFYICSHLSGSVRSIFAYWLILNMASMPLSHVKHGEHAPCRYILNVLVYAKKYGGLFSTLHVLLPHPRATAVQSFGSDCCSCCWTEKCVLNLDVNLVLPTRWLPQKILTLTCLLSICTTLEFLYIFNGIKCWTETILDTYFDLALHANALHLTEYTYLGF